MGGEMTNRFLSVSILLIVFLAIFLSAPIFAQAGASMTAPVVRNMEGQVVVTTRVTGFSSGGKYRIGIGCVGANAPKANVEALKNGDQPLSLEAKNWVQSNTKDWWQVEPVQSIGIYIGPSDIPEEVLFRISIAKEDADQHEKMYIFVSKDYGSDTWYLEDGVELEKKYW
jgi:hypothetical protein